jgi:hypothetical protein
LLSSFRTEALNKLMGGRRQTGLFSGRDFWNLLQSKDLPSNLLHVQKSFQGSGNGIESHAPQHHKAPEQSTCHSQTGCHFDTCIWQLHSQAEMKIILHPSLFSSSWLRNYQNVQTPPNINISTKMVHVYSWVTQVILKLYCHVVHHFHTANQL